MLLSLSGTIYGIGLWIVVGIYNVAAVALKIFLILATGDLVSADTYSTIITNFYIIIGVVMLFILAFSILKGMVNPDDSKQGTSSVKKIIINLVSSGVIMALLPTIFAFAYDFQDSILLSGRNTIGKFFGYGGTVTDNTALNEISTGAYQITNGIFTAFFNVPSNSECSQLASSSIEEKACQDGIHAEDGEKLSLSQAINTVETNGTFSVYTDFAENAAGDEIDFNFLLSLIAGLLLIYVSVSFCFDMALRLVKLVFYQIIAPIPLFLRIIPGKLSDIFSKWTKVTLTCYLEVYVRIFIFYFCVYLSKQVLNSQFLTTQVYSYGIFVALLTKAFVLMGIIMFMRQAPKLFKEITGLDSGNMKLGIRDKLKEGGAFAAGGAIGGLVASRGNPMAAIRGLKHGWKNGDFKNVGQEISRNQEYKEAKSAGASRRQILADTYMKNTFGMPTKAERELRKIDEAPETVKNRTSYNIEGDFYDANGKKIVTIDKNGNEINGISAGSEIQIDKTMLDALEAQKAANTAEIAAASDEIRALDKKIAYGEAQIKFKSGIKGEAEKKIDEPGSKVIHTINYTNAYKWSMKEVDGKKYVTNGQDLLEVDKFKKGSEIIVDNKTYQLADFDSQTGYAYYMDEHGQKQFIGEEQSFNGNYDQIQEFINKDLSPELRQQETLQLSKIRDDMVNEYISKELSSQGDNLIKQLTRAGFTTLENNNGFEYLQYAIDGDGKFKLDENGNRITHKGSISVKEDELGNYIVTDTLVDEYGRVISERVLSDSMDTYKIIDELDKKAKGYNGILKDQKQNIDEKKIDKFRGQNEAIDNLKKQSDEQKEAKRKSEKQRGLEASKKYVGNRGNK